MNNIAPDQIKEFNKLADDWIDGFEKLLQTPELKRTNESYLDRIKSYQIGKELFGSSFDKYVKKKLEESEVVKEQFKDGKNMLGKFFEFEKIRDQILTNKEFERGVTQIIAAKNAEKNKANPKPNHQKKNKKPKEHPIISSIKTRVHKADGSAYPESNPKNPNINLIDKESNEIKYSDITNFNEFAKSFSRGAKYSETQEALAWFAVYINSDDFSKKDMVITNGVVDRRKTIVKIAEKINEKALTPDKPFTYDSESDTLAFSPAPGGVVDVVMFIENSQKIVGASATRDRTYRIEGNQFIRHSYKLKAMGILLEKAVEKDENLKSKPNLTASDVKSIVNEKSFLTELNSRDWLNKIRKEITKDVLNNSSREAPSEINTQLGIIRSYNDGKAHGHGLTIPKNEIDENDLTSKYDSRYVFFGEVSPQFPLPELMAGLNKISYKENFQIVSNYKMDSEAITKYLDTIDYIYNNAPNLEYADKYAHTFIYDMLSPTNKAEGIESLLSEGAVYKEERQLVFKSLSTIINEINDLDGLNRDDVLSVFKLNLSTLSPTELDNLTDFAISGEMGKSVLDKTSRIQFSQSEVPDEYRELKNGVQSLSFKINAHKLEEKRAADKAALNDLLRSKSDQVNPETEALMNGLASLNPDAQSKIMEQIAAALAEQAKNSPTANTAKISGPSQP